MPINLNNITVTKPKKLTATFFHPKLTGRGGTVGYFQANNNSIQHAISHSVSVANMESPISEKKIIFPWYALTQIEILSYSNNKTNKFEAFNLTSGTPLVGLDHVYGKPTSIFSKHTDNGYDILRTAKPTLIQAVEGGRAKNKIPFDINFQKTDVNILVRDADLLKDPDFPIVFLFGGNQSHAEFSKQFAFYKKDVEDGRLAVMSTRFDYLKEEFQLAHDANSILNTAVNELKTSAIIASEANLINDESTEIYQFILQSFKVLKGFVASDDAISILRNILDSHYQMSCKTNNIVNADFAKLYLEVQALVKSKIISVDVANASVNGSLRLMLAAKLEELRNLKTKDQFYKIPYDQGTTDDFIDITDYSKEQYKVITTQEPLVVAAAGAGTGKSHTLTGRLRFLKVQGQDLNKVLVLSFTNTAAKNIQTRYPGVQSLTLADMFNQIYNATFPNQSLTNPNTLSNTLQLLDPTSGAFANSKTNIADLIAKFSKLLDEMEPKGFKKSDLNKTMAAMSSLIQDNMNDILLILNSVGQTTLALQPIVINAALSIGWPKLQIPDNLKELDIIITDESQDISTFEYIMLLDMSLRRKAQLMIVGDGSQTLYEFRNSNPKFLTSIQASKVFTNFNLTTNYRSHGTILAFANPLLSVIDANDEAKIQLVPKDLRQIQPSEQDFKDHIVISNHQMSPLNNKADSLADTIEKAMFSPKLITWVNDAITRGETVAVLSATNKAVSTAYDTLPNAITDAYPNTQLIPYHLESNRQKPNDVASTILTKLDKNELGTMLKNSTSVNDLKTTITNVFTQIWSDIVLRNNSNGTFYGLPTMVQKNIDTAFQDASVLYAIKHKDEPGFTGHFIGSILKEETRVNDFSQYIKGQPDVNEALANSNLVFVTGHSAKGLEFDNVVVIYDESNSKSSQQDSLRMLYVTLTRAKSNEYLINIIKPSPKRSVGNTFLALPKTPLASLQLMTKHYAQTGEFETVIVPKVSDKDDDKSSDKNN